MADIHEVQLVPVEAPALIDLRATAIKPIGHKAWHVFISPGETDYWLCFMDCQDVQPLHFNTRTALFYAKLAILLGETWDDCWLDPHDVLRQQRELLCHISPDLRRRLNRSSLDQLVKWRRELEPRAIEYARGEQILKDVLGVELEAACN